METTEKQRLCPQETSNILSKIFFWWVNPLLWLGYKKDLDIKDLWDVPEIDESQTLTDRLEHHWTKEAKKKQPSLVKAVTRTFGVKYFSFGLFLFVLECGVRLGQPWLLKYFIKYFEDEDDSYSERDGYIFATGIVLCGFFYCVIYPAFYFGVSRVGMEVRIASCSLVYRKSVKLSQSALSQTTVGQMVNLLSNDVNRFDTSLLMMHFLWVAPCMTIISAAILWYEVRSFSILAGYVVLVLQVPIQGYMGRLSSRFRLRTAGKTDERVRVINEVLDAIKVIKMYAWETPFFQKVVGAREDEMKVVKKTALLRAVSVSLFFTSPKIIVLFSFAAFVWTGNTMTAANVFATLTIFNNLRLATTLWLPLAVAQAAETLISLKRLQKFLLYPERDVPKSFLPTLLCETDKLKDSTAEDPSLRVNNISASWDPDSNQEILSDISFTVNPGELVAIIGSVGAGKSSLLQAILRELPISTGNIHCPAKIGYTSQEAWIFAGTVEQNILLGRPMDTTLFRNVVQACAFDKDLKQLPQGQNTFVGDKGITLSGGQKARLSLARALYQEADVYLLDDPLSAVDAHVGRHLFDFCIMRYLKNKPRVLVTHQIQFLNKADKIIVLKEGKVLASGTMADLKHVGIDVSQYLEEDDVSQSDNRSVRSITSRRRRNLSTASSVSVDTTASAYAPWGPNVQEPFDEAYVEEVTESKTVGKLRWKTYWIYLLAGASPIMLLLQVLLNIATQVVFSGTDLWLSYWTTLETESKEASAWYEETNNAIYIYAGLTLAVTVFSLSRCVLFFKMCMKSSLTLHSRMFKSVLRSPMKFFDDNPAGRILNRFARDTGSMDEILPTTAMDFIEITLVAVGIIAVVGFVNVWMLIPSAVLILGILVLRQFYLATSQQLKRVEGIARSPVYSHLATTLLGLSTIRACRVESDFCQKFDRLQDTHSKGWFHYIATSIWFGVWIDWMVNVYLACLTYSFMFLKGPTAGEVGLALVSAVYLTTSLPVGARRSAEITTNMTAVERIIEYTNLQPEAALESKPNRKPPPDWPQDGSIHMQNMTLAYDDRPVLHSLCLTIKGGEKIGIVGRTGAGKSSFISALFRLTEISGTLMIDGVDASKIGLHDLRTKLSIIPQEPVLFAGPLRKNLDPFGKRNDDQLWDALEQVQLKDPIAKMPNGLDSAVTDHGTNFSVGQRQLICLARAILNQNKILVLDEATANVDQNTDQLIQRTLRNKFKECTTITIAHRLDTVIDSDRILVLDAGKLEQFGPAYQLLQDKLGMFHKLVQQTGPHSAKLLFIQAGKVFQKQQEMLQRKVRSVSDIERSSESTSGGIAASESSSSVEEIEVPEPSPLPPSPKWLHWQKLAELHEISSNESLEVVSTIVPVTSHDTRRSLDTIQSSSDNSANDISLERKDTDNSQPSEFNEVVEEMPNYPEIRVIPETGDTRLSVQSSELSEVLKELDQASQISMDDSTDL